MKVDKENLRKSRAKLCEYRLDRINKINRLKVSQNLTRVQKARIYALEEQINDLDEYIEGLEKMLRFISSSTSFVLVLSWDELERNSSNYEIEYKNRFFSIASIRCPFGDCYFLRMEKAEPIFKFDKNYLSKYA